MLQSDFDRVDRDKSVLRCRRGQSIFSEGNPAVGLYCIYSGALKLYKIGPRGEEQVIRLLGPGDMLGYRALFADEPYAATAEAIEPTTVCSIPKALVLDLVRHSHDLSLRLLALFARELRVSEEQMLACTQESVKQRVARLLLSLYARGDGAALSRGHGPFPLKRREIAQIVAPTPETLSRCLRALADRRIIELSRSEIRLTNVESLKAISRGMPGRS